MLVVLSGLMTDMHGGVAKNVSHPHACLCFQPRWNKAMLSLPVSVLELCASVLSTVYLVLLFVFLYLFF